MKRVNVLVVTRMELYPGFLDEIAAVSPRVSVKDGVKLFAAEQRLGELKAIPGDRLEKEMKAAEGAGGELDSLLAEAEIIVGGLIFPQKMYQRAPNLKWLHVTTVGMERYSSMDFMQSNIIITNSRGVISIPIAEQAIMFMLMLTKKAQRLVINKEKKLWDRYTTPELYGKTAGLIGAGSIGNEIAKRAKGLGMKVIATKRSVNQNEPVNADIDKMYPPDQLKELLHNSDFVIVAAPLTAETKGMIGIEEFKAMKKTAHIINIARGPIINESAMIRALKEGWIAGAGLDVFEVEPLPPDNELWVMPNVIISPHSSGVSEMQPYRLVALVCDNLRRYINHQPLLNLISHDKGY
jgi:D-2-hydroxyacid dehydrogenase (NADP+)